MRRFAPILVLLMTALAATAGAFALSQSAQDVAVHEWGTFTTVAGEDGQALNWVPLGGPTDLPCFVEHFQNAQFKIAIPLEGDGPIEYEAARTSLVGKVRMETPVLYFYSPTEANVSVSVRFPRGLMTEWYPKATAKQALVMPRMLDNPNVVGAIDWPSVRITPNTSPTFMKESRDSHYYAARETDAAPVNVGGQTEKFLFYRGVASFPVPITAALGADGSVLVTNLGADPIPAVIVFDNTAGKISYRNYGELKTSATIARPSAPAEFATLRADLVKILTTTGLFTKEAEAMVETWRDSWFEEGTRVFYVLPSKTVDAVLPLAISPAPKTIARAFVGRMEIITPDAILRAQTAIAQNDTAALQRQGRFLGPIIDRLVANVSSVSDRNRLRAVANQAFASYAGKVASCK